MTSLSVGASCVLNKANRTGKAAQHEGSCRQAWGPEFEGPQGRRQLKPADVVQTWCDIGTFTHTYSNTKQINVRGNVKIKQISLWKKIPKLASVLASKWTGNLRTVCSPKGAHAVLTTATLIFYNSEFSVVGKTPISICPSMYPEKTSDFINISSRKILGKDSLHRWPSHLLPCMLCASPGQGS